MPDLIVFKFPLVRMIDVEKATPGGHSLKALRPYGTVRSSVCVNGSQTFHTAFLMVETMSSRFVDFKF